MPGLSQVTKQAIAERTGSLATWALIAAEGTGPAAPRKRASLALAKPRARRCRTAAEARESEPLRPRGPARAVPNRPITYAEKEVREHLPLVRQVVQRMLPRKPPEVPTEDLVSWGVVGLLDAMRKYDPHREATFSTYAQYRIRGSILDYLRRCDWLPRSIRQRSHDLEAATMRLERRLGRQPDGGEIATELGITPAEYSQTLAALGSNAMIPTGDVAFGRGEEGLTEDDTLSDAGDNGPMKRVLRKERVQILAKAIECLPEKERIVVSFYYFEGLTMREMAEALHLTEGRISQLHSQAMGRLRGSLGPTREDISVD
jgi:RNA polymerase sigma factor for flagellar operon FliA